MAKTLKQALKTEGPGGVLKKGIKILASRWYLFRAGLQDRRLGRISLNSVIPTRFAREGAYSTQSSDYRCLKQVFREAPLEKDAVFVDVGCGEGRLLSYLYLKGHQGPILGIELDPAVANTARERMAGCENVTVVCKNILDCGDLLVKADAVYLFNPFAREVLCRFVALLEAVCVKPLRMYYLNDLYADAVCERPGWETLCCGVIHRFEAVDVSYTVFRFCPPGTEQTHKDGSV